MRVRSSKAEVPLVHNVEAWAAVLAEATAAMSGGWDDVGSSGGVNMDGGETSIELAQF